MIKWFKSNELDEKVAFELLKQVNWTYVSFEKLLEIFKTLPFMRQNSLIKSIFSNEVKTRATKSKICL